MFKRSPPSATPGYLVAETLLVLGDQLSTEVAPWDDLDRSTVVLLIESEHLLAKHRHRTRVALYLCAMRAFAERVRDLGFTVDYRRARSFREGVAAHLAEHGPRDLIMNHPRGRTATRLFSDLGVTLLPDPFFMSDPGEFASRFAKKSHTMETFYRDQRRRLGMLMDSDGPVGGRWNFDEENRKPLPRDGGQWPEPWRRELTDEEREIVASCRELPGEDAVAYWPRTRADALDQLRDAVERIVPHFGPYEDAASSRNWHLAHTRLSPALNMGLLHPREVVDAIVAAYQAGQVELASAEGLVRQIIGWREWVWLWHRVRDDDYTGRNALSATESFPAAWRDLESHTMNCLDAVLGHVRDFAWAHHIERLMVLGNAATLAGIEPVALTDWMVDVFVDGAEWVMEANGLGMGTWADGGLTTTKPYISGGNYLSKMTDFCKGCQFSPTERTGERACPLTTLYWQFLIDHSGELARVNRMIPVLRSAERRPDREEIAQRAPVARRVILTGRVS